MRKRKKIQKVLRALAWLGRLLLIILLTFALLETSTRLYFRYFHRGRPPNLTDLFIPNPYVGYANKPLFKTVWCGVSVSTNSVGFRENEITQEKPEDVFRIMVLGDSISFGWWVEREKTFPAILQRALSEKCRKNRRVEVLNTGVIGYSTRQERIFFEKMGYKFKPDLVILAHCFNDLYPTEDPFGNLPYKNKTPKRLNPLVSPSERNVFLDYSMFYMFFQKRIKIWISRDELRKTAQKLKNKQNKTSRLQKTIQSWKNLKSSVLQNKSSLVIISFPQPYDIANPDKSLFVHLKSEFEDNCLNGINLANVFSHYKGDVRELYYEKDIFATHMSERGHALTAKVLEEYLMKRKLVPVCN